VTTPRAEYSQRLDARRAEERRWSRQDARLAYARLAVFAVAVVLLILAVRGNAPPWLLAAPAVAFGALLHVHDRVLRRLTTSRRAIAFYERGLARIEDRWIGTGDPGDRFADEHHLYAHDLDLFGRGSLFELLSVAATAAGEETLAAWLKSPAAADEVGARQRAVAELTSALDLRESLGRAALDVRTDVHTEPLLQWAEHPRLLSPAWLAWIARLSTASVVAAMVAAAVTRDIRPLLAVLVAQSLFIGPQLRRIEHVLHRAAAVTRDLDALARLLTLIGHGTFEAPLLRSVQQQLRSGGAASDGVTGRRTPPYAASRAIGRLHWLVEVHDWQHNNAFLVFTLPFLVGTHIAWAIESWRARHGTEVRRWLAAAGEFEALASLSAYRYEHPDDPFPEVTTGSERPARFEGTALGHPLLPAARMVRNDVALNETARLFVVSGSNMSGKSTLLRTVGTNAVLAFAGAPVRAQSLRLSPLALGATLRIQDSLQEGRSRFYAEITRIRELADVARGGRPLLFLLDELFHGTNSHDRLVGASGVLRSLLDRGAIGLVTTHDLALTAIADNLAPHAANVHFEEWFDAGEMRFDYRLKPGRVTRSNALALMRAVGLEVDTDG
jgi:hypothetical protein